MEDFTKLTPEEEALFQKWYKVTAQQTKLNPNPDDPNHFYDYRGAYKSGIRSPNIEGHWPSQFKLRGHPRMIIDGINTKTGEEEKMQKSPRFQKLNNRIK